MTKKKSPVSKCYTYIRVSTEMQVDGYSLDAQKDTLTKYAEYHGMKIVREYCDAGKSGKSITGRPEFTKMLQDITDERDNVDYVLVFKLSRFGRNAADVLNSLQRIQDFGVNLICVEDGIDSSKESGKLTITVLSAVAEIERENILVQTMEGRKQKAREGKWNGGLAPFGYTLDKEKSTLIINPDEAEIVKVIFDMFAHTNKGTEAIAEELNRRGYVKNKSRDFELGYFTRGLVTKILDNPVYLGKIAYGRTTAEKVKGTRDEYRRVYSSDYLLADGLHEAIVDEGTWDIVRKKRSETGVKWNKTHSMEHEHILSGLAKCPVCGAGLVGQVHRRVNKKTGEYNDKFYYFCLHRKKIDDDQFCNFKRSIPQEKLNAEVENVILDMINDENVRDLILSKLADKTDVSSLEKEKDNLKEKLGQVEGSKRKLTEQMDKLDINDHHYDRKYQDMQDRLDNMYDRMEDIRESLEEVKSKLNSAADSRVSSDYVLSVLKNFGKLYDKMTDLEKKEFYHTLIERIDLYPDYTPDGRILKHIEFKFPVAYDSEEGDKRLIKGNDVETVVLLTRTKSNKPHR
jgi:site-specific DNA recombinase